MVVLTTAFCGAIMPTIAQDKLDATVQADIVSQYIWRGQDLGDVSLQPTLGLSYKGLSLTAWGSVGLTDPDDTKEFDLTLSYKIGGLNIGITDYWFNTPSDRYFLYAAHETSHVFEGNIGYDFGPVALQWYTNFAGNDGVNKDGKRAYSSYLKSARHSIWPVVNGRQRWAWCLTPQASTPRRMDLRLPTFPSGPQKTSTSPRHSTYRCSLGFPPIPAQRKPIWYSGSPCALKRQAPRNTNILK